MIVHEITLDGYAAQCDEQPIRLGTAGSYGVEALHVLRKGEWEDYDIIIAFRPPKGESVQMRLGADNSISVPAEATAAAGTGEITFAGYTDGVRQISVSRIYRVAANAGVNGTAPAEPTPDIVQQILSAARSAEKTAEAVRADADAGKFKGDKGERGEPGVTGPAGPQGERGPRGEKGDKGDTGEAGAIGPQGPKGDVGPAGADGKDAPQTSVLYTPQILTEAQKRQARTNINAEGFGTFELIQNITLSQDVPVTRTEKYVLDFSDTPLSAVKIITQIPKGQSSGMFDNYFYSGEEPIGCAFCSCINTTKYPKSYVATYVFSLFPQYGLYTSNAFFGGQGDAMNMQYASNGRFQTIPASLPCTSFQYYIFGADPQVMVAGTTIKVYGVRA